jgi:hypothetical protein
MVLLILVQAVAVELVVLTEMQPQEQAAQALLLFDTHWHKENK